MRWNAVCLRWLTHYSYRIVHIPVLGDVGSFLLFLWVWLFVWFMARSQLSMRLQTCIRERLRRSVKSPSPADWTVSCYRWFSQHQCEWEMIEKWILNALISGCRKVLKSLLTCTCRERRGPGGGGVSPVPPAPLVPSHPDPPRTGRRARVTTRPPAHRVTP